MKESALNQRALLPEVHDTGIPPHRADGAFQLDPTQAAVAYAAPDARLIVEAGPGHGKTAVACARVAHLLDQGVPGTQILLLSFTRTAVREMRQRIGELARSGTDTADIRIMTIDSWASRLRSGYLSDSDFQRTFDDGIRRTNQLLCEPTSDLSDRIAAFRHILVDEAQDLVGMRAQLIAKLLCSVGRECGFTVFLDPAQGIYDWAEDDVAEGAESVSFADLVQRVPGIQKTVSLGHLHRTANPDLRRLLLGARSLVLDPQISEPATTLRAILAEQTIPGWPVWNDFVPTLSADSLILFRRRGPVLEASAWLANAGIPHRIRIGGLPQPVAPWLAALVHDAYEKSGRQSSLTRSTCEQSWVALGDSYLTRGWTFDRAWSVLRRLTEGTANRIDARRVADTLLRGQVPDDFHTRELGSGGPVLGTVHGSKGREGSRVVFMVPAQEDWRRDEDDGEEGDPSAAESGEARVLYVAITRARERLDLYNGRRSYWSKIRGRDWTVPKVGQNNRKSKKGGDESFRTQFEIGREGDLDPAIGMVVCPGGPVVHQAHLRSFDGTPRQMIGLRDDKDSHRGWKVFPKTDKNVDREQDPVVATLDPRVERDIKDALNRKSRFLSSSTISHLYQLDTTTHAIRPDHPALDLLPEPWRTLRLIVAPVVVGLGSIYARRK
jgi:hypothetical protein